MKLMLIGGGEIGRGNTSYETKIIDQEIIKMTNKSNPNILFIGLASNYSDSYYDTIKNNYKELGCNPSYLKKSNLIHNKDLVKQKFKEADIIYVGGGDTIKLLDKIKEYQLETLLNDSLNNNKVLAGISAGAILFSEKGYSDAYILRNEKETYEFISGLGYANITIIPHYHRDENKTKQLEQDIRKINGSIYGLENGTALKIENNKMTAIKSIKNSKVFKIFYKDKLIEEEFKKTL